MNEKDRPNPERASGGLPPPLPPPADPSLPSDELDALLRQWHTVNAARAAAGRDRLLSSLSREAADTASDSTLPQSKIQNPKSKIESASGLPPLLSLEPEADPAVRAERRAAAARQHPRQPGPRTSVIVLRRIVMNRYFPAAALVALVLLLPFILPPSKYNPLGTSVAKADNTMMCPEGGRLDARDDEHNILGPCALAHTDVVADVSGFLTRVTVKQKYHNPYASKIEAVYTFPLSNHAAVDRMNMKIGNREIIGQVKERQEARQIYEQAKAAGYYASLLEQERPNIFTQSIANIEPGADIDIEISYVEITQQENGEFSFVFPTVVGPRYVPGTPTGSIAMPPPPPGEPPCPDYVRPRRGIVLLAPATISALEAGDTSRGTVSAWRLAEALKRAQPIRAIAPRAGVWYNFRAAYADGSVESGTLYTDGTGTLNSRWFYCPPGQLAPRPEEAEPPAPVRRNDGEGAGFSPNTNQVPDASRITPMPVRPPNRAGHDISITVNIDTGGPALVGGVKAPLHEVVVRPGAAQGDEGPAAGRTTVTLASRSEIPNRDFVLKWKQAAAQVEPSVFTHTGHAGQGNFFEVTLLPPERVDDTMAVPRELIFVLDTSGSMNGFPIEKAKALIDKAIGTMRAADTFNVITFAGETLVLWNRPRPATQDNRDEARQWLSQRTSSGGTEMMKAINAALEQRDWTRPVEPPRALSADELANLPADGREVRIVVPSAKFVRDDADALATTATYRIPTSYGTEIVVRARAKMWAIVSDSLTITGKWNTDHGSRYLDLTSIEPAADSSGAGVTPLRIVMFLTDGYVGNDMAIIDAIQRHRGTTRVFSFGIGNAVNRYLLDGMARAGGGEAEYVFLSDQGAPGTQAHDQPRASRTDRADIDRIVERFNTRVRTPVLTNISVQFSPDIQAENVLTALGAGGGGGGGGGVSDLTNIPDLFDVKPLTIVGQYAAPARGTVTISGQTAAGPWHKTIDLNLPAEEPAHDTVATLWARTKVESIMNANLSAAQRDVLGAPARAEIVSLGEKFGLLTQYTAFVAVDRLRITYGGQARLIHIPIELPQGTRWEGFFGGPPAELDRRLDDDRRYGYLGDIPLINLQNSQGGPEAGAWAEGAYVQGNELTQASIDRLAYLNFGTPGADREELRAAADQNNQRWQLAGRPAKPADPGPPPPTQPSAAEPATLHADAAGHDLTLQSRSARRVAGGGGGAAQSGSPPAAPRPSDDSGRAGVAGKPAETPPSKFKSDGKDAGVAPARTGAADKLQEAQKQAGGVGEKKEPAPPASTAPPATEEQRKRVERALSEHQVPAEREPNKPAVEGELIRNRSIDGTVVGDVGSAAAQEPPPSAGPQRPAGEELATLTVPEQFAQQVLLKDSEGPRTSHDTDRDEAERPAPQVRLAFAQQALRYSVWLVKEKKLDEARHVADLLADAVPTYKAGVELRDALADEQLTEADRDYKLSTLDKQAEVDLSDALRRARLARRLDPTLYPLATPADPAAALEAPKGATMTEGGLLLTILVQDTSKATIAALEKAGLKVEDTDTRLNLIVGAAPLTKVADVALVDGVRRVEPTHE